MFGNFSLPELLLVAALALIVIGPKDLPRMMRSVGKFVGQARGLAKQFQDSMNDAAREADLEEFREARSTTSSTWMTTKPRSRRRIRF
jgi:sec-independent protein translocase protein TatB